MPTAEDTRQREDLENQVWTAIAAFEQIVETMPTDRVSLEALSNAYEQVGDLTRSREYLVRLVDVLIAEGDRKAGESIRERVAQFAATDPQAKDAGERLEAMLGAGKPAPKAPDLAPAPAAGEAAKTEDADLKSAHVVAELSFAWTLFQAGELSQEEYASVAQDLSEVSAGSAVVSVSVLHVLHDRASRSLDRVIAFASRDSGTPIVPLDLFDVPEAAFSLLPVEFMVRYGTVVFALMGNDVLAIVLNPYNKQVRAKVEQTTGKPCHFYLATPAAFDALFEKHKITVSAAKPPAAPPAAPSAAPATP
jgi:hypothetical protein